MGMIIEYMDTSKLQVGSYYSYKELCEILNQPVKTNPKTKENQLLEFSAYFKYSYNSKTKKYKVTKIYDSVKYIERPHSSREIYKIYIEHLLLRHLMQVEGHKILLPLTPLYKKMGVIDDTLGRYHYNKQKLVTDYNKLEPKPDNYPTLNAYDARQIIDRCYSKLREIIESALNSLQNQKDIQWSPVYEVLIYSTVSDTYYTRQATTEECSLILKAEHEALKHLKYKKVEEVHAAHKDSEYYKLCGLLINEYSLETHTTEIIQKYWKSYLIIYNKDILPDALNTNKLKLNQLCLNAEIINYLKDKTDETINEEYVLKRLGDEAADYIVDMMAQEVDITSDVEAIRTMYKDVYNYLLQLSPDEFYILEKEKKNAKRRKKYKESTKD